MFEEKLIAEIEKHSCLWDKRQLCYRDRVKKELAWKNISAAVGEHEENCRKRWKSLRDRYGTELKVQQQPSGSGASFKRTWPYFDSMSFLKDTIMPRQTTTNIVTQTPEYLAAEPDVMEASFGFEIGESGDIVVQDEETIAPTPTKRQKKNKDEDAAFNELVSSVSELLESQKSNSYDNFLGAIGEVFEKVPEENRLEFKMDVLQYVHVKYKNVQQNNQHS